MVCLAHFERAVVAFEIRCVDEVAGVGVGVGVICKYRGISRR
jgi:hypothetical protein